MDFRVVFEFIEDSSNVHKGELIELKANSWRAKKPAKIAMGGTRKDLAFLLSRR